MTSSMSIPVWRLDRRPVTKGASVLNGVRVVSADETWAVGSTIDPTTGHSRALVGRWAGDFQFMPPAPAAPTEDLSLTGVDWVDDTVWAVGHVSDRVTGMRTRIERYQRNSAPEVVASPSLGRDCALRAVAMLSATDGWAVGGSGPNADKGDFTQTFIVHWDGTGWTRIPAPNPGTLHNQLNAVAAKGADDVWAVGHSSGSATGSRPEALVLHWDGAAWEQVPVPPTAIGGDELLGVATLGEDSLWLVGTSTPPPIFGKPTQQAALALHWNGSTWQTLRSQGVTQLTAVSAKSETDVWLAGYAELPGAPENAQIVHWDGQQLSRVERLVDSNEDVASALTAIAAGTGHMVAVGWRMTRSTPTQQPAALLATS